MNNNTKPTPTDNDGLKRYIEPPPRPTEPGLARYAWDELSRARLFTPDGDFYAGMTGRAVMSLIDVLVEYVHSGMHATIATDLFRRLAAFEPLGPLTDDPDEWCEVADGLWQSRRQFEAFSRDGGRTYRLNSDPGTIRVSEQWTRGAQS